MFFFMIQDKMNTITIKNGNISKTDFNSTQELFVFLREELSPLELFAVDETNISETSLKKIKNSQENPDRKLTNFQG